MRSIIPTVLSGIGYKILIGKSQSLLNEVKYSNIYAVVDPYESRQSQSLLNEVKYSNIDLEGVDVISLFKVAIPFK